VRRIRGSGDTFMARVFVLFFVGHVHGVLQGISGKTAGSTWCFDGELWCDAWQSW
jgi:hypothetical protein